VKNKGEDELAAALEALLEKHELDINSGGCSAAWQAGGGWHVVAWGRWGGGKPVCLKTLDCLTSNVPPLFASPAAGEREIARAKVRLQTQRDLDGIDSSNIITGGRQRRGGGAPVSYKAMIELPSDSEEEDEEESASEDDEQQSGSDAEAGGCAG
jgi:hypothetical protein